jgi:S-adenosyl-L-methionine hydrolase (adenosine-forming)
MFDTITFLTDFGLQDDFVGVCKGVIKGIARDVEIIDITHGIAPQAVTQGALVLARSVTYMPPAIHLAVVDPGVGGDRRAVAIRTSDGHVYVGPDNGLLSLAAPVDAVLAVRSLTNARYHREPVSRTFHARDIFAPAAAHLASGVGFDELGDEVDPATLVRIELPKPGVGPSGLRATVLAVDRFGNLGLNVAPDDIDAAGLAPGDRVELLFPVHSYYAVVAETFADAKRGDLILYQDSYGAYSIAISGGNASALTDVGTGEEVRIVPRRD